jgi:hypothetical protein
VLHVFRAFSSLLRRSLAAASLLCLAFAAGAAAPPAEQLLPDDTLAVVTAPDFPRLRAICQRSPRSRLWNDPALRPLREKFFARWQEEFVRPLERELGLSLDSYGSLLQGQITFAITKGAWQGSDDQPLGFLFLLDTGNKAPVLRTNLATLRTKWLAAGRPLKTERIRDVNFSIFPVTTNDMPRTLARLLWRPPVFAAVSGGADPKQAPTPPSSNTDSALEVLAGVLTASHELAVGQVGSLLVAGNSVKEVEKVVARLTGGARPTLGDLPAFHASYQSLFCKAPFYGWVNLKGIVDPILHNALETKASEPADALDSPTPDKLISVTGLAGCKSLALALRDTGDGSLLHCFLSAPYAARQGLSQVLAVPAREAAPPPFVPANAAQFFRWRIDGPKTWASLEKMFNDLSPQALSGLNIVLNTADARARLDDPSFNLRQTLLASLGDDIVWYERAPRGTTAAELQSSPSILLLASPHPDLLAAALKRLFVVFPQGDAMTEREFLGRKIYSVGAPSLSFLPGAASHITSARMLHWAASGSHVALSSDAALLEEHLRNSQSQAKPLRNTLGLLDAAQKVGGMGSGFFGYENDADTMHAAFETARIDPTAAASGAAPTLLPGLPGLTGLEDAFTRLMDFSLLPAFDKVAHYYGFTVYALSANTEGLTLKVFSPTPAAQRSISVARRGN